MPFGPPEYIVSPMMISLSRYVPVAKMTAFARYSS